MAWSFNSIKYYGAVYQRNPLNSCEHIWMTVVEIPSVLLQGNPLVRPFSKADFQADMHHDKCTLIICRSNNASLLRCRPYVLVLGEKVKDVDHAVAVNIKAMEQFMQILADKSLTSNSDVKSRTRSWVPMSKSKQRKLMIPGWLLSDYLFLQQIKGAYCFINFTFFYS